ncbi:OsmC family protein [Actinopolymorpha rutila]
MKGTVNHDAVRRERESMTTTTAEKVVNGVDAGRLFQTITAIEQDPAIAKFNFRLSNFWVHGAHNRAVVADFDGARTTHRRDKTYFVYDKDEHPALLGEDRGANPVEYLLAGLAGCVTTTLVYHAAARGITLTRVDAELDGDIDLRGLLGMSEEVRPGYQSIRMMLHVEGDASREELADLVRLAERRSPVADAVMHGTPLQLDLADEGT